MTDEVEEKPAADPMAKARAAKAAKALQKAEAEAQAAEASRASKANGQPVKSSLKGKALNPYRGEEVEVRVTAWGDGQISTGGEDGFERWGEGAVIQMPEYSARANFNKRWVEPVDQAFAKKWIELNRREVRAAMAAKGRTEFHMEHGVALNEEWRSALTAGELSFSPRDEEFRDLA